ncbi:MAG: glycosyltransferase family 9 protein [Epsilonproteobacteria bacterium]|nr:glycosyltransferase family 9 protein [Campylobacterota bacterium]
MSVKSVLIIRCGALGDLVYATSVIDALKLEYTQDTIIDFVCTPGSGTLFNKDTRVNKVFSLKHKKIPYILSSDKKKIVEYSKKNPYDLLINFEYGKQFKSLLKKIVAKKKVGALFNDIEIDKNLNRGELQKQYFKSIVSKKNLDMSFPKVVHSTFEDIKGKYNLQEKYIVIAPSNSHVNKKSLNYRAWENKSWVELIKKLSQNIQVVIVGAKGEKSFFKNLQPYPNNVIDLVGKNNIYELNSVVKYAQAVVCTDSAVGHIAAALNTQVFILMGPNSTVTDSPYKTPYNKINIISKNLECSPCYKTEVMKNCKDNKCMKLINVNDVYDCIKSENII